LKASYFEAIDTIQSEFSNRFSKFDISLTKSLRVLSPASNFFLDIEELQTFHSLVNSTTKNINEDLLDSETTTVKSIVSSKLPDVFLKENTGMNLDQIFKWFWKCKVASPTIHLLLSAGLAVGVSTAKCEASFSSVVMMLTPHRRCVTHDHTGA